MTNHMKAAMEAALKGINNNEGGPFGAVIVQNGQIIATGNNQVILTNDPTAHAEIVAIRRATQKLDTFILNDCEIYTTCEPCPMCLSAIYWARLTKISYGATRQDAAAIGFDDEFLYTELTKPLEERKIPVTQIHRNENVNLMNIWLNKTNKILY